MTLKLKVLGTLFGALVLAMTAPVASAYTLTYNVGNFGGPCTAYDPDANPNNNDFLAGVADCAGTAVTEVYKQNVGGSESGSFAASYETAFFNTPSDPADATITNVAAPAIECSSTEKCFLGLKDGRNDPAWYVFDISDWDGTSSIVMAGFWPDNGAISHVSIFSSGDGIIDDDDIPEPASLALVGIALLAAGAASRRRRV